MSLEFSDPQTGQPGVVTLSGEWDVAERGLSDSLRTALRRSQGRLIVDLLNVSFIDSSVIGALLLTHRDAQPLDGWVRVVYTNHEIRRVIEICGLSELFPQFPSVEAALRDREHHQAGDVAGGRR
jgi:anti-anti-sigma factor